MRFLKDYKHSILLTCGMIVLSLPNDSHWPKWLAFAVIFTLTFSYICWKQFHWTLGLVSLSTLSSGLMAYFPQIKYHNLNPIEQVAIAEHAMKGSFFFFAMIIIAMAMRIRGLTSLLLAFPYMLMVHSVYSIAQFLMGVPLEEATGLLPNISIGSNFVAAVAPTALFGSIVNRNIGWFIAFLVFLTNIIIFQSSMAWLTLGVGVSVGTFLHFKSNKYKATLSALGVLAVTWLTGHLVDYQWNVFLKIDRFQFWPLLADWWVNRGDIWFGTGTGTFAHFGPNIQQALKFKLDQGYWYWAHSDFLQIIFETGIFGITSALLFVAHCIRTMYKFGESGMIVLMVSYLTMCLGNYPLRLAEFALYGTILFALAVKQSSSRHGI